MTTEDSKPLDNAALGTEITSSDGAHAAQEPGRAAESWVALCARAAVEEDPGRLLELVKQINRLLDARRQRLINEADGSDVTTIHPKNEMADGKSPGPR